MNKQKLLQFLFPELQIVESFKKNGFISKNKSKQSSTKIVNSVHNNSCNSQNTFDENVSQLTLDIRKIENKKVSFNGSSPLINPRETRNKLDIDFDNAILTVNKNFVGQKTTIEALINAFKRPFIRGVLKDKPKNTIVLIGSENIGKTKLVEVVVQALKQENVLRNSIISSMDLSFYPSGNEERLFLADLYKVLNEDSEIVVFTNLENGHASILKIVSELVKNGKSQLDARYALQENNLIEATGVLMRSSISEISANNKYFVLVSHLTENGISNLFDSKFMENVSDIVKFGSYSESEITEITKRILAILSDRTQKYLGNKIIYSTEFLQFCSEKYNLITGLKQIVDYIEIDVYSALTEYKLQKSLPKNTTLKLDYLESKITLTINNKDFETNVDLSLFFPKKDTHSIEEIVKELEDIVGNEKVKKYVLDLENNLKVQQIRQNAGFKATPISMHMIFTGNPGTGKTTIARIIAKYFKAIGLLSTGQLREVSRVDLVSQYVGNTAKLTNEVIQSAMGGVLFIDEAYSLCRDKNDIFGIEAVDSLVKAMEDYRDDLVVILAGYQNEMESFLKTNSGLASRFPNFIEFEDYKAPEMVQIADITAKSKGYKIEDDCKEPLLRLFEKSQIKGRNDSGNGRLVRNVIEKAILMQGNRVLKISDSKLDILKSEDFNFESSEEFDLEKQLNEIIGLENVKDFVRSLYKQLIANEKRRKAGIEVNSTQSLNMIFTGNPGTGKTTISRILATMFKEMGLLKKGHLVETDQGGLIAGYVGQTAKKTEELFRNALGGVLFIDEAYALSNDRSFGKEAIDTLIKLIEDFRGETVVILAGYKTEMAEFIKSNSGIESRFPLVIDFPDYTPSELYEIAVKIISQKGFTVTEDGLLALKELVTSSQKSSSAFSGNGRMARNIIEQVLRNQSSRIATNEEISFVGLTEIKREDVEQGLIKKNTYDLEKNLSNIVGLEEVKTYIRSLSAILRMQNERKKMGLPESNNQTLHMIFKGNPGTGKTMIARTIADVLFNIGVIKTNKLVETDRAGLVAGYVGQTALKTREIISEAMNGVLFIDEAYSLSQGGAGDFGREAIDTLVKLMDDNRERLVVILAGYSENMNDFLLSNPGLKSRFPNIIEFPDYSVDELMTIANNLYLSKGYFLKTEARNKLESTFKKALKENSFGNGRYVRNIFERTLNKQALRLNSDTDLTREELTTIMLEDIEVLF